MLTISCVTMPRMNKDGVCSIMCMFADLRNGWKLISPKKSFVVYAATAVEKQQWISHIQKCVGDLLTKRKLNLHCVHLPYTAVCR